MPLCCIQYADDKSKWNKEINWNKLSFIADDNLNKINIQFILFLINKCQTFCEYWVWVFNCLICNLVFSCCLFVCISWKIGFVIIRSMSTKKVSNVEWSGNRVAETHFGLVQRKRKWVLEGKINFRNGKTIHIKQNVHIFDNSIPLLLVWKCTGLLFQIIIYCLFWFKNVYR